MYNLEGMNHDMFMKQDDELRASPNEDIDLIQKKEKQLREGFKQIIFGSKNRAWANQRLTELMANRILGGECPQIGWRRSCKQPSSLCEECMGQKEIQVPALSI